MIQRKSIPFLSFLTKEFKLGYCPCRRQLNLNHRWKTTPTTYFQDFSHSAKATVQLVSVLTKKFNIVDFHDKWYRNWFTNRKEIGFFRSTKIIKILLHYNAFTRMRYSALACCSVCTVIHLQHSLQPATDNMTYPFCIRQLTRIMVRINLLIVVIIKCLVKGRNYPTRQHISLCRVLARTKPSEISCCMPFLL